MDRRQENSFGEHLRADLTRNLQELEAEGPLQGPVYRRGKTTSQQNDFTFVLPCRTSGCVAKKHHDSMGNASRRGALSSIEDTLSSLSDTEIVNYLTVLQKSGSMNRVRSTERVNCI